MIAHLFSWLPFFFHHHYHVDTVNQSIIVPRITWYHHQQQQHTGCFKIKYQIPPPQSNQDRNLKSVTKQILWGQIYRRHSSKSLVSQFESIFKSLLEYGVIYTCQRAKLKSHTTPQISGHFSSVHAYNQKFIYRLWLYLHGYSMSLWFILITFFVEFSFSLFCFSVGGGGLLFFPRQINRIKLIHDLRSNLISDGSIFQKLMLRFCVFIWQ